MAFLYSAFYDYSTALLRPTLYLIFRDISKKLRNLALIFVTYKWIYLFNLSRRVSLFNYPVCVFVYLFGCLYSSIYSDVGIHLFIRTPIGLVPCLNFLSYLATHISL